MSLRVGSLCTGYGGIEMGLRLLGIDVDLRWLAETDPSLDPLHPAGVSNLGDINAVDWARVEPVQLLTAGFPCQPVSAAGAQLGAADSRWLWPAVRNAIAILKPRGVLLENVRNLASIQGGALWRGICSDLLALGYCVRWLTLGACHAGAAHHQHRLFALALIGGSDVKRIDTTPCGARDPLPTLALLPTPSAASYGSNQGGSAGRVGPVRHSLDSLASQSLLPTPTAGDARGSRNATAGHTYERASRQSGTTLSDVSYGDTWRRFAWAVQRHAEIYGPPPAPTEPNRNGAPRLAPAFAEWLMCLPAGHVTDKLARRDALRAIGNGVCPPQLAAAWRLLTTSQP